MRLLRQGLPFHRQQLVDTRRVRNSFDDVLRVGENSAIFAEHAEVEDGHLVADAVDNLVEMS